MQVTDATGGGGVGSGEGLTDGDAFGDALDEGLGDGEGIGLACSVGVGLAIGERTATGVAAWPHPARNSPPTAIAAPRSQLISQA